MPQRSRHRFTLISRAALLRLAVFGLILSIGLIGAWCMMIRMPGSSYQGALPPLTAEEVTLRDALQQDVRVLAGDIKQRNYLHYEGLTAAANFLETTWTQAGYRVQRQSYDINGQTYSNLIVELRGRDRPDEIVVVGAHYDSVYTSPAANDNGSGAAATLELALRFFGRQPSRTLRFVQFVNEEPPFFWTDQMGSLVYAKQCREKGENIVAMMSLETMGYYSDEVGSQKYPFPLGLIYPLQGNFIGFIGNFASGALVRQIVGSFRQHTQFPSEGAALTNALPGVGWSDHWSFWQQGYAALMVTDTAPFRYPYYHTEEDTSDKIDYDRLARVVAGLERVISELVQSPK